MGRSITSLVACGYSVYHIYITVLKSDYFSGNSPVWALPSDYPVISTRNIDTPWKLKPKRKDFTYVQKGGELRTEDILQNKNVLNVQNFSCIKVSALHVLFLLVTNELWSLMGYEHVIMNSTWVHFIISKFILDIMLTTIIQGLQESVLFRVTKDRDWYEISIPLDWQLLYVPTDT